LRVFALGGYGKVGFPAIRLFAQNDLVAEIAIVGRSQEREKKVATEIGEKAIAVHPDGPDEGELTSLLAGYDIIMNAATNSYYDPVESDPASWLTLPDDFVPMPKMWTRAVGRSEGLAARCTCWFTTPMWNVGGYCLTSVALAVAVRKILRGEIRERGVMTAEMAIEPLPFFDEVAVLLPDQLPDRKLIGESFERLE